MKMKYLSSYHPIPLFIYFISVIVISMFATNPIILSLSLVGAVLFTLTIESKKTFLKGLIFYIPFFILIALTNPLFSHNGVTPLFYMNDNAVTLEAILYGIDMAAMLVAVIYWCKCYSEIYDSEKFIYLFGKAIPKLSLVISISLKFIPMFKRQYKKIRQVQTTLGYYESESYVEKIKSAMNTFSALVTWSLEMSVEQAMSMKAKGYGLKKRTHFNNFKFTKKDIIFFGIVLTLDVFIFSGLISESIHFVFYPEITKLKLDIISLITYIAFGILALMPATIEIKENLKWKYYISKM